MEAPSGPGRSGRLAAAGLVALAVLVHLRGAWGGWLWDDDANVTNCAPVLAWRGLLAIWTDPTSVQQYYPLTHTTFWIEHKLWGLDPLGFHAVNVLLHALNALLLRRALLRLGLGEGAAWIAAALFAVHPVQVESVAWVTERKNTLSMAFYLGSGLLWLRWAGLAADRPADRGRLAHWAGFLALFVAALLSKSATVTLPALLLVVAWWRRGRVERRDVLSLLPAFALAAAAGILTTHLERTNVGAQGDDWAATPAERLLIAGRALWVYSANLLLPVGLRFVYPQWKADASSPAAWLWPAAAVALPAALLLLRGRIGRGPAAAALAFGGTMLPMLGLLDVYFFRFSYVSDHFLYHASAAPFALAGVGLARAAAALDRRFAGAGPLLPGAVLLALSVLSIVHAALFRDVRTLWTETARRNPSAWIAWSNLGVLALQRQEFAGAEVEIRRSLSLHPRNAEALNNLGICLENQKRYAEAAAAYRECTEMAPALGYGWANLGRAYVRMDDLPRAIEALRAGAPRAGSWHGIHANLVETLRAAGRIDEALQTCREAERLFPQRPEFTLKEAEMLQKRGDAVGAVEALRRHVALLPAVPAARQALAAALAAAGRFEEAAASAEEALAMHPEPELEAVLRRSLESYRKREAPAAPK
jgi:tetratricopeptide (TPR) repeat protein